MNLNQKFDAVLFKDVIEHLRYYEKALEKVIQHCKKELILCMFIKPNNDEDKINLTKDGYYLNKYNKKKLFTYIENQGLKFSEMIWENDKDQVFVFKMPE